MLPRWLLTIMSPHGHQGVTRCLLGCYVAVTIVLPGGHEGVKCCLSRVTLWSLSCFGC